MFPNLPLVQYCERAGDPALTAEPLNALSNLGFLVVAALAAGRLRRTGNGGPTEWALTALAASVGVGSLVFHTLATPWAMAADVIPISAFVLGYAVLVMRRFLGFGWAAVMASLLAVAALEAALSPIRCSGGPCLNGSVPYLPALAMLMCSAAMTKQVHPAVARRFLAAMAVFALALVLRSLDHTLCDRLTLFGKSRGTHALWHLLNAGTLALLLDAAIISAAGQLRHCTPRRAAP